LTFGKFSSFWRIWCGLLILWHLTKI
jgi:hypothetical protein